LIVLSLSLFRLENCVCLSHGVQVAGAAWRAGTRIVARVGDLVQRTTDGRTGRVLSGRAIERLGGVVCGLHRVRGNEETCFLVEPQNQGRRFVSCLVSKPLGRFTPVWPQNRWLRFPGLGLKIGSSGLMLWASKSPRQVLGLGHKTKQTSVCRLCHKTDGGRTAWDTR
jgi:hypothetical protein